MAEQKNNQPKVLGVIFDKFTREAPDAKGKNGGNPYYFTTIVLETDHPLKKGKTFPAFELGSQAGRAEDFAIGDEVEITYFLERDLQKWKDKNTGEPVEKYIAKNKALYIKHSDTNVIKAVGTETAQDKRRKQKQEENWDKNNPLIQDIIEPEKTEDLPF